MRGKGQYTFVNCLIMATETLMELDIKFIQRILDINNRLNPVFWYWYYDLYSVCQNYLNNKILNFNHHIFLLPEVIN